MQKHSFQTEKVTAARWLIRSPDGSRKGEVFGRSGHYQAQTMRGRFVGNHATLNGAAELLFEGAQNGNP